MNAFIVDRYGSADRVRASQTPKMRKEPTPDGQDKIDGNGAKAEGRAPATVGMKEPHTPGGRPPWSTWGAMVRSPEERRSSDHVRKHWPSSISRRPRS